MQGESLRWMFQELETALSQLIGIHSEQQFALARLDSAELQRLAQREHQWLAELESLQNRRDELLAASNPAEGESPSLRQLIAHCCPADRPELFAQFDRIEKQLNTLRNSAVANWLATYRSSQHVESLLEGVKISCKESAPDGSGAVFDSSA